MFVLSAGGRGGAAIFTLAEALRLLGMRPE